MRTLRIAVVGDGVAGRAAAHQLRRQGHRIEQFEQAPKAATTGAGLLLHPPTLRLLQHMGLREAVERRGARVHCLRAETVAGRRIMHLRYADHAAECYALGIQRTSLLDLMQSTASSDPPVRFACEIAEVDAQLGVLYDTQHRRWGPFDVVIAADGANSRIRRRLAARVLRDREYPWKALVCLVEDPQGLAGECVWQRFHGTGHVSSWPVGAPHPGGSPSTNLSLKLPRECAPGGHTLGAWKPQIARLCPMLAPLLATARDDVEMLPYAYRDVALRSPVIGRVVLLGDAAHSMSPQLGQGVRLALEDALELATALHEVPPAEALSLFARRRRRPVRRLQRYSRLLTPLFQSDSLALAHCRDRLLGPLLGVASVRRRSLALLCRS